MGDIIVYVDKGVDGLALRHVVKSLQQEIDGKHHSLKRMDAASLKTQPWEEQTSLLIIPGGRDVYYQSALHQEGTLKIKSFVARGGMYLGLCAGAYFAADAIEFEKGGQLEVCAKRSLEFYPGLAIGPAYGINKYSYQNERGVEAALISWKNEECSTYFNGGCFFDSPERFPHVKVLGNYANLPNNPAAVVMCHIGKGRALLSGVHLEYSSKFLMRGNPYIDRILSSLEKAEERRRKIFREVLENLNIRLKK